MLNVFVLGPDELNRKKLKKATRNTDIQLHDLLSFERVSLKEDGSFQDLLSDAEQRLNHFSGSVDGIISLWDFPSTLLAAILCRRRGLNWASPRSVMRCEHKYWSRQIQREAVPEQVPPFQVLDPFADDPVEQVSIDTPFWLKPIKGHSSLLGFRINKAADLRKCLPAIRERIDWLGSPFSEVMEMIDLPPAIAKINGRYCVAEGIIGGRQCTLEGYVRDGKVEIYGIVDSRRYPNRSTFQRYQYPSRLSRAVKRRMIESASAVISEIGLNNTTFNIEYFYRPKSKKLWLLEINPRCSQSHADLFEKVDGVSHQHLQLNLALGREITWHKGAGHFPVAAKFFYRCFDDGVVDRVPGDEVVLKLEQRFPECLIDLQVQPGDRLSDQKDRESYSFELARIYLGARDTSELLARYRACREVLERHFAFQPAADREMAHA